MKKVKSRNLKSSWVKNRTCVLFGLEEWMAEFRIARTEMARGWESVVKRKSKEMPVQFPTIPQSANFAGNVARTGDISYN